MLCLSLRALRYSFFHLVRATFLHLSMQRSCLLISGTFSSSISSSGSGRGFPYRNVFGDNTSIRIPSSTYIKGWLLSVTFLSKTISSNLVKFLQISSSSSCGFVQRLRSAIICSNSPSHHRALLKLNIHCSSSLVRCSCINSSLMILFIHFDSAKNISELYE